MSGKTAESVLRKIPAVGELVSREYVEEALIRHPRPVVIFALRNTVEGLRNRIIQGTSVPAEELEERIREDFEQELETLVQYNLRKVINATGVIIHTNLGRSILAEEAVAKIQEVSSGYSNLEYDLEAGRRGSRYSHVEEILTRLTGAESACVVNNNAGAVFLSLNTIARGREVVVSRGQLVEIGGSFRIPDIMAASGCELVEVGTTNRTHRSDYENAVTERTGLLLKVHTSNFRVIGFSRQVELEELVELGRAHGVPVMEDLGSGNLTDLGSFGLAQEPTAGHAVQAGADVVTFSGDKLLGGPQAGVILGRAQILDRIKRNPLMRILRVDKMTLAGLEATLKLYQDPEQAMARIPTLRLMMLSGEVLADRAHRLATLLAEGAAGKAEVREEESVSTIGGGALPGQELPTWAVSVEPSAVSVNELEASLRSGDPPVIGRIEENRLFLDVRTVAEDEIAVLAERVVSSLRG